MKHYIETEEASRLETRLNKDDKRLLLELIGNEQIHMIIKDNTKYNSDKYKRLEELKVRIKDL